MKKNKEQYIDWDGHSTCYFTIESSDGEVKIWTLMLNDNKLSKNFNFEFINKNGVAEFWDNTKYVKDLFYQIKNKDKRDHKFKDFKKLIDYKKYKREIKSIIYNAEVLGLL